MVLWRRRRRTRTPGPEGDPTWMKCPFAQGPTTMCTTHWNGFVNTNVALLDSVLWTLESGGEERPSEGGPPWRFHWNSSPVAASDEVSAWRPPISCHLKRDRLPNSSRCRRGKDQELLWKLECTTSSILKGSRAASKCTWPPLHAIWWQVYMKQGWSWAGCHMGAKCPFPWAGPRLGTIPRLWEKCMFYNLYIDFGP
jgi:hypothetical protein